MRPYISLTESPLLNSNSVTPKQPNMPSNLPSQNVRVGVFRTRRAGIRVHESASLWVGHSSGEEVEGYVKGLAKAVE